MGCFNAKRKVSQKDEPDSNSNRIYSQKTTKSLKNAESIVKTFRLEQTLAILPFGSIVKATHISSNLTRAIKIINYKSVDSFILNERHLRLEVNSLSNLDHPNILKVFDILHDDLKIYMVMEYWDGGLLLDKIKEKSTFTEKNAGDIISQILLGVSYCHEKQVIHRDLNPKVIFMMNSSEGPQVKIGEFGASSFLDPEHKFEGKFDNSAYVAPEVPSEDYNEKCDVWSVGVILYVLFTGMTPFTSELSEACEETEKMKSLNTTPLEKLGISPSGIDLVKQLLNTNYFERISAVEALGHPWFTTLKTDSSEVTRNLDVALAHLRCYTSQSKLIDAIQGFIARQVITHKENKDLIEVFKALDSDWDGKLSKAELKKHYLKVMPEADAIVLINEIFQVADSDNSGFIEFSEFLKSSVARNDLMSKKHLEATFKMLDCDNSGKLSRKELQSMLSGTSLSGDKKWMKLLQAADKNQDGEIDMKEFYDLLLQFQ